MKGCPKTRADSRRGIIHHTITRQRMLISVELTGNYDGNSAELGEVCSHAAREKPLDFQTRATRIPLEAD